MECYYLYDMDATGFPNIALMKLSAYFKSLGHKTRLTYHPVDGAYASCVFKHNATKTLDSILYGGSGFNFDSLPDDIEHIFPDYNLYNCEKSYGFLTRGCIRNCEFCIVHVKEGDIRPHSEYTEFVDPRKKDIVLMDNNILASEHGIRQLELLGKTKHRVDPNQGLDFRLIDNHVAKVLSKVKWYPCIRLACDREIYLEQVIKTIKLLRCANVKPRTYFVYILAKEFEPTYEIVKTLKGLYVEPFVMVYKPLDGTTFPISKDLQHLRRWVNKKQLFNTCTFDEYKKGCL